MGRNQELKILYTTENPDNKKLESYQLESRYQDYEDKLKHEDSDYIDAGEISTC
jgi:hypothetical protein